MAQTRSLDGELLTVTGDPDALLALEAIEKRDGEITVAATIVDGRSEDSALHKHFTWDVNEGFRKNLEREARQIIRSYKLEIMREDTVVVVPRFVSVESGDGRAYQPIEKVAGNESFGEIYKLRLLKQLEQLKDRLEKFREFEAIVRAIESVSADLQP